MDDIDRKICRLVQQDGKVSTATLAEAVGLPLSTAADRLRRLAAAGVIRGWEARLDAARVGVPLCAFVLVDMDYEGEADAAAALAARPEVLELHHVSGAHSYLMKLRLIDMAAAQRFLAEVVKPLAAVNRTETIFALDTVKETLALPLGPDL
jgi:Lrp/AsnC family leucine-responsive transcriptional regulator